MAYGVIKYALGGSDDDGLLDLLVDVSYDVVVLLVTFGLFVLILRRTANQAIRGAARRFGGDGEDPGGLDPSVDTIRRRLEAGPPPPLGDDLPGEIAVFASGHTHAPSLIGFDAPTGARGAAVNCGCWLRQAHPVAAHLKAPSVFASRHVLTHARVHFGTGGSRSSSGSNPGPTSSGSSRWKDLPLPGDCPSSPTTHGAADTGSRHRRARTASRPPAGART